MWELLLVPILLYFSYTDWRTREIDDRLVYGAFLLGLLLNIHRWGVLLLNLGVTALVVVPLYFLGAFALGDLWIALIIAAFWPEFIHNIPVSIWALGGGILLGALYGFVKMVKRDPRGWVGTWLKAAAVGVAFSTNPLGGIILGYVLSECYPLLFLLLPLAKDPLPVIVAFLLGGTALKVLREAGKTFTVEKIPEEGDIPAEVIDEGGKRYPLGWRTMLKIKTGEIKPIHSLGADGLTKEDARRLKELGIEQIRVKEPLPLVPFITAALLLLMVYQFFL